MKDELLEKVIGWVDKMAQGVSDELPEFIQEVVNYGF
jgi:hypothetical protein